MSDPRHFIVTVMLFQLDQLAIETGSIATLHVSTLAADEKEAVTKAVVYNSDGGEAIYYEDGGPNGILAECIERSRWLSWKAIRCLPVSPSEFDTFLCLTDGLTTSKVCK